MSRLLGTLLVCGLSAPSPNAHACSSFAVPQSPTMMMGKSYDWHAGHGLILTNPRDQKKTALIFGLAQSELDWTSEHGSVTFSQFGHGFPLGGINEAGVAVEIMWLNSSIYPGQFSKPKINELQWIQYILDLADDTAEAVQLARTVDVEKVYAPVHYLVCDRRGQCASFEYIDGTLQIHESSRLELPTLTNSPYAESLDYAKLFVGFGGTRAIPSSLGSLDRFVRLSHLSQQIDASLGQQESTAAAFAALDSVRWQTTQWQTVYHLQKGQFEVKHRSSGQKFAVDLAEFDFDCDQNVVYADLTGEVSGERLGSFRTFSPALNRKLIEVGNQSVGGILTDAQERTVAAHVMTYECVR